MHLLKSLAPDFCELQKRKKYAWKINYQSQLEQKRETARKDFLI